MITHRMIIKSSNQGPRLACKLLRIRYGVCRRVFNWAESSTPASTPSEGIFPSLGDRRLPRLVVLLFSCACVSSLVVCIILAVGNTPAVPLDSSTSCIYVVRVYIETPLICSARHTGSFSTFHTLAT